MKKLTATICLTLALLLGSVWVSESADFKKGVAAFKNGDYTTALHEWKPHAEQGVARAQSNLALMYANGKGVGRDYNAAVKWYRLAAERGMPMPITIWV